MTTAVEVPDGSRVVILKLLDEKLFTVALDEPDVAQLVTAARDGEISYVSAQHVRYGRVLLGIRPHVVGGNAQIGATLPVPLALYLELPGKQVCDVLLDGMQSAKLVSHLDEGLRLIGPPLLGE